MIKMYYAEILVGKKCSGCLYEEGCLECHNANLDITIENITKYWFQKISFDFIGISGNEPLDYIGLPILIDKLRNSYPKSSIVLITDEIEFSINQEIFFVLLNYAPSRLFIIINDSSQRIVQIIKDLISKSGKRYLYKNNQDLKKGIKFLVFDKHNFFEIELYKHSSIQQNDNILRSEYLDESSKINYLFRNCGMRKYLPVFYEDKIFKCRIAARLWIYFNNKKGAMRYTEKTYWINEVINGTYICKESSEEEIKDFIMCLDKKALICKRCYGTVECAYLKKKFD